MKPRNSTLNTKREKPRRIAQDTPKGFGASIFHPGPFRSPDLLKLASVAPKCFHCEKPNDGTVVGCHSNWMRDGKGKGLKAHDIPAFLCQKCHMLLDGQAGTLTKFEKTGMFYRAAYDSMVWVFQSGFVHVSRVAA